MAIVMLIFFVVIGVVIGVPLMRTLKRRRLEQQLLDNPPEMVCFKVKLPVEADKSNLKATRFWDRLAAVMPNDEKMVQSNENVIHAAYVAVGAGIGRANTIRFLVWCHPSLADRVQLALNECYDTEAEITEASAKDDPLFQYAEAVRVRRSWEQEQEAAARVEDEDE